MLMPSNVLVPRPISSSTIRLRAVALFRMFAVSCISTMNVLRPRARSSLAPTRVNTRSTIPISASAAGTNEPICAMITISATCRMYVDLPAMFGPVMMMSWFSEPSSSVSFGTNRSASGICSTTGWRPSLIRSAVAVRHRRPHVAQRQRPVGERGQHVEPREGVGRLLDARGLRDRRARGPPRTARTPARATAPARRGSCSRTPSAPA